MKHHQLAVRGLNYHIQEWGEPENPTLFLLHGWMDCGASYKFVAEYLSQHYHLIAPDWRGFGETDHATAYWFPDYFADLECILNHYAPGTAVNIVGHSMGGNIALMYSGIRPERVAKVVSLEGLGMPETNSDATASNYAKWLDDVVVEKVTKIYPDVDALKASIRAGNPSLSEEIVTQLVSFWGKPHGAEGQMRLKHDHAHRYPNPIRYNFDDVLAVWAKVSADVGIVMAKQSPFYHHYLGGGRIKQALDCFSMQEQEIGLVDDATHMLHLEQPEQVASLIREFFAS